MSDAVITSLIRDGRPMIPRGRLILHEGDEIQVTTTIASRDLVLHRLTARRSEEQVP